MAIFVLGVPFLAQGDSEVRKVKGIIYNIISLAFSVNKNQGFFFAPAKLRGKCGF